MKNRNFYQGFLSYRKKMRAKDFCDYGTRKSKPIIWIPRSNAHLLRDSADRTDLF